MLVECDTGMGRCGVQTADDAVALAEIDRDSRGLVFGGLMTYPAAGKAAETAAWLAEARRGPERAGLPPDRLDRRHAGSVAAHEMSVATEYRPGTYIYLDRYQVAKGVGALEDCALTVLATVVSRPTADRAIIDAGSKALTSDLLGLSGFGLIRVSRRGHCRPQRGARHCRPVASARSRRSASGCGSCRTMPAR